MIVARVVTAIVTLALLLIVACTNEQVTVVTISSVTVVPANASAVPGDQLQFQASVTDENGQPVSAAVVTWSSVDPAIASIDADGLVVARSEGSAEIRATFDGVSGSATVRVLGPQSPPPGFTLSESGGSTRVTEAGGADSFTAVLTAQPTSNVVLDVTSSDTGEATVAPASLTFTPSSWSTPQTVTVTGVDDALDDGDQVTTVTVSVNDAASDDLFDLLADRTVTVVTVDDDNPPPPPAGFTLSESGGSTRVTEAGGADSFTAVLTAQPTSNVVLDIRSSDTGEAIVAPASLTFTPTTWSTPQTVTVTGVDDTLDDGDQATTVTVSVNDAASDNRFDALGDRTVTVVTVDDDNPPPPPAGFTLSESGGSTRVTEAGGSDSFTAVLTAPPASNVVLDVRSSDTGEATAAPGSLTFTPVNWSTPQTVTVTGVDDTQDDGDQVTTVTVSVNDAASDNLFDPVADRTVTAVTIDDDNPPPPPAGFTVSESGGSTRVSEAGGSDSFTAVLTSQPASNVVLDVTSSDTGEATVIPGGSLTFTPTSWSTPQTVTVTGVDDTQDDGDQATTVTVSVNDGSSDDRFDVLADRTVTAVTIDDDNPPPPPAGFTVSESGGSTRVTEAGGSDTFTAVLTSQPVSNVVLDVTSSDTGEATVTPGSLTFTPSSWSTPQTVTVTGVDDTQDDGDQATAVTVSVNDAASDNAFDPLADRTVTAVTIDDDNPPPPPAGFDVSESGGSTSVSEGGGTDGLIIVLTSQPASNVVVDVRSSDTGEATVSPGSLTFTPASWSTPQTVTVTGVDDTQDDGDQATTVTVSVNDAASDDRFDVLADQIVTVTTVDDDDPPPPPPPGIAIVESGGSTRVSETGSSDYFTVVLTSQPATNVVLDIQSEDTGEVTASPGSLTFTPSNWDTPQTVTVAGVADLLPDGDKVVTVTVTVDNLSSDDAYDGLAEQVSVTNVDSGVLPG